MINSKCAQRIIQNSKLKIANGNNSKLKIQNSKFKIANGNNSKLKIQNSKFLNPNNYDRKNSDDHSTRRDGWRRDDPYFV
ncbi:MAG: hypothetical protein SO138_03475, partial [Prevotella sp.]|nr:hypothetical protein [Prevotella sp.]